MFLRIVAVVRGFSLRMIKPKLLPIWHEEPIFVNDNIFSITDAMESSSVSVASSTHTTGTDTDFKIDATVKEQLPPSKQHSDSEFVSIERSARRG